MLIKKIDANNFDVFWGNGWFDWARFHYDGTKIKQMKGVRVPPAVFFALKKRFGVA